MPTLLDQARLQPVPPVTPPDTSLPHLPVRPVFQSQIQDPVMQIRDLDFYYGKFKALKKVNLDIARRQVTAFIGPSGCGKSTLLRTFNRMFDLYPGQRAEGQILVRGENILDAGQDVNLLRAKVGMVSRSRRRRKPKTTSPGDLVERRAPD